MTGREYQHIEDLVFCEEQGAQRAVYILKNLQNYKISVKWDGMPTVYFGRDEAGKFTLVGKNGWGRDWINSPEELEKWVVGRGKNESWRTPLAKNLADIWRTIEPHCNFMGYVFADVLWSPARPAIVSRNKQRVLFHPNQVTYIVNSGTELFTEISNSKLGIAVHSKFERFGDSTGVTLYNKLNIPSRDVVVVPQTVVSDGMDIPVELIQAVDKKIRKNESKLESLFFDRPGLSDFRDIIYRYVNYMNKNSLLASVGDLEQFKKWIEISKLSFNKQGRMRDIISANQESFALMFEVFLDILDIKNLIIERLDAIPGNISAIVGSQLLAGGEGFIVQEPKVKLVPRHRWKPPIIF